MRKSLTALVVTVFAAGCGGGSTVAPTPADTRPAAAVITVTQNGNVQLCISPLAAFSFRVRVPVTVRETAGLKANLNFVRLDFFAANGSLVERREIGASTIVAGIGTNTIVASSTNNWALNFDFNASSFAGGIRMTFNYTDDRLNTGDVTMPPLTNVTTVLICG